MILIVAITLVLLGLNVFATSRILRDEYSEKAQQIAQLLFVWLVPVIGSIAIWGMYRSEEKSPGTYRDVEEPDDDLDPPNSPLQSLNDAPDGGGD
jgi:hypothetical protein